MAKVLLKGNEAVVKGAILAGCRFFFGYPITPASEIAETAAYYIPLVGGTFIQAESEIGAINMVYGASSGGVRAMTASSGPGLSLKQEGISYLCGAELPCVIVDIMRGGPGLGNIAPDQGDYNQMVKGGGHGSYKVLVLAPNSVQEMCNFAILAFELADKYRNPVIVLTDGFIGQMMEPVEFPEVQVEVPKKDWALYGEEDDNKKLISSIYLDPDELEEIVIKINKKYKRMEEEEVRYEASYLEDAELVTVSFGVVSRILSSVVERCRKEGYKVGYLRPITLFPFPKKIINKLSEEGKAFLSVELSNGQMVDDVRLNARQSDVHFYGRMGGNVPSEDELYEVIVKILKGERKWLKTG
ncbi:3-methyl-2-oxobutanoate dehydrogenase subunit beta [candidate division KSB1 bacterium]|nr:MAG: 3-methyl-2-oxobutanoate dehydrogenase subunit beta [candidate division KSB1 bacterium]